MYFCILVESVLLQNFIALIRIDKSDFIHVVHNDVLIVTCNVAI